MQKWMNFTHNRVVIQTFRRGGCVFSRKRRLHEAFTHDVLRGVYNFSNSPENVFLTWAKRNTWLWVSYIRFNALCPWCLDCRGFQGIYHAALTHQNHLGEFSLTVFSEECSVLVRLIKYWHASQVLKILYYHPKRTWRPGIMVPEWAKRPQPSHRRHPALYEGAMQ